MNLVASFCQYNFVCSAHMVTVTMRRILNILIALFFAFSDAKVRNEGLSIHLDLGASGESNIWRATGTNGTIPIDVPATVPGGIYSDLEAAGLFTTEIYAHYNDRETKWVGRTDWTFTREFTVSDELLAKPEIILVCEGLDTISSIYVNNVKVGDTINMFIRYEYKIKSYLQLGVNEIRFEFKSPVFYAAEQQILHNLKYGYYVLPNAVVPEYQGENLAQMIRKVQASFSWDWGPSYPSSGIYKAIYIEGYESTVIRDTMIFITPNKPVPDETTATIWNLTAQVFFTNTQLNPGGYLTLTSVESGSSVSKRLTETNVPASVTFGLMGNEAKLWWPNGYGEQPLYDFDVKYSNDDETEMSTQRVRIGFRTIELVEDHVDEAKPELGREFYLKVNGRQMYSKGSNSIPIHVLPEKATNEMAYWLLLSAKETHTNVIRIWGGGIYYQDEFYERADELGILIWQDFMFAVAMYPANPEFLETVKQEVESQVKRLQHYTCLAVWAANNENEGALRDNWFGTEDKFEIYKADYIKLYIDTVVNTSRTLDPSRKCLPSSPSNGIKTEEEGWVAEWPGDWIYGDTHPYDYYSDSWDWKIFRKTRYASEFGYQSFPHISALEKVFSPEDMHYHSNMMYHRQHHPKGQAEIKDLIDMHLPLPSTYNSSEFFPHMLYLAQIEQSVAQKSQAESYRRLSDKLEETTGYGHNMGALYWQLNDIWPGASWASVEIDGRWKMLHYYAKNFLAPVLASPYLANDTTGDVVIELISDATDNFSGMLNVKLFRLNSLSAVYSGDISVEALPLTSRAVHRVPKQDLDTCRSTGVPCFVFTQIDGTPDNYLFLDYPKDTTFLQNPNLQVTQITASEDMKSFELTLTSDAVAPFVFLNLLEQTHGWFSENGFIMTTPVKTIRYESQVAITVDDLRRQLAIQSLYDVSQFM